jgi:hypothetical protein
MRVLIDGSSGLINILYANTLDHMKIPRCCLCPSEAPFYYGIILGMQVVPLGSIQLPFTFREPTNFRKFYTKPLQHTWIEVNTWVSKQSLDC